MFIENCKIGAAIDCQGFAIGRRFYPREIAFKNDLLEECIQVNPNLNLALPPKALYQLQYQKKYIHGLSFSVWSQNFLPISQALNRIQYWTTLMQPDEAFLTKNNQFEGYLYNKKINFVRFAEYFESEALQVDSTIKNCQNHEIIQPYIRCAQSKANSLWKLYKRSK